MRTGHNSSDDFAVTIEEIEDDLHSSASKQVRKICYALLIQVKGLSVVRKNDKLLGRDG